MGLALFVFLTATVAAAFGPGGTFHLEHSTDGFGLRSHGVMEMLPSGRAKFYPLPQSTARDYFRLRREDLRTNPFQAKDYDRQEVIGPYQIEGGKIWFGKRFYDSEGMRGVGAFGYFDTSTRTYTLFSPVEVAPYEVSAILVQPDSVWLGLDQFVEDISTAPGGLARWDRSRQTIERYPLEFNISRIRADGDSLRLDTRGGYALYRAGVFSRFRSNGKAIERFPPPPSHQ